MRAREHPFYAGWKVCKTCGLVLEHLTDPEGWLHPTWVRERGEDHVPVPVLRSEAEVINEVCDFCFEMNPRWELPTKNFEMPVGAPLSWSDSSWAACDGCADLLRRDMWTQLSARSQAGYERTYGPMTERGVTMMRRIHRSVRRNVVGPVQLNDPTRDKNYGDALPEPPDLNTETRFAGEGKRRYQ